MRVIVLRKKTYRLRVTFQHHHMQTLLPVSPLSFSEVTAQDLRDATRTSDIHETEDMLEDWNDEELTEQSSGIIADKQGRPLLRL